MRDVFQGRRLPSVKFLRTLYYVKDAGFASVYSQLEMLVVSNRTIQLPRLRILRVCPEFYGGSSSSQGTRLVFLEAIAVDRHQ